MLHCARLRLKAIQKGSKSRERTRGEEGLERLKSSSTTLLRENATVGGHRNENYAKSTWTCEKHSVVMFFFVRKNLSVD